MSRSLNPRSTVTDIIADRGERRFSPAAYRSAARHSRRVRILRRAVPVILVGGVLVFFASSWLDPLRLLRELPIEFAKLSIAENKLKIEAPKISGFTRDGREYKLTAETAAQDLRQPGVIELTGIVAELGLAAGGSTKLTAAKGTYEAKEERLTLREGIDIRSTNGFVGHLAHAVVEMKKGHVLTQDPIDLKYQDGRLTANRLEIFDNGARAVFDGGVTTWLKMPPPETPTTPAREATR
jgi:lipopolysaccharide export system protein LptC